jgi:hypothetical protein
MTASCFKNRKRQWLEETKSQVVWLVFPITVLIQVTPGLSVVTWICKWVNKKISKDIIVWGEQMAEMENRLLKEETQQTSPKNSKRELKTYT